MLKKLTALCCLVMPFVVQSAIKAQGLSAEAQGDYVLLNMQAEPTKMHFRLFLQGKQWMADNSNDQGKTWHNVCNGKGECRLADSTEKEIADFFINYPDVWEKLDISCIHNVAFAFCGLSDDNKTDYVMVALKSDATGIASPIVIPFYKLK